MSPTEPAIRPRAWVLVAALALLLAGCGGDDEDDPVARGRALAADVGCSTCHSTGADAGIGPGWADRWGADVELDDGRTVTFDEAYVRRSITDPEADVVAGFGPSMPRIPLDDGEIDDLTAYLREVSGG